MSVGAITPYGTSGAGAAYFTPVKKLYQTSKAAQSSAPAAYEVTLTAEAKVKAMELQGYTVSMISAKLGLDPKTVEQYLGIAAAANETTVKPTYTPPKSTYTAPKPINATAVPLPAYTAPKSTYVAPKAPYAEPQPIAQGRAQLTADLTQLPNVQNAAFQLISSAKKETSANALSQALTQGNGQATGISCVFR